ncbi:hypothetical protein DFQ09_10857 [Winogradskyella pacifica]|uniref:SpoIIAA-like protein n=1 Tax=Winogradskyella pacifica TaxID=664642 RepID=A0A3D9LLB6_9FLAO|nr:hypothetical protein [Winogradskyella pacifica]REE08181.1 hypothetical protein DFQ09_10857 [Winogradskyella pacifica]
MIKKLTFIFGELTIYDNYVLAVMKEGVTISPNYNDVLIDISATYFHNKQFIYITHRVHSYSVDPQIYYQTEKIKNLIGFAVVSQNYQAKLNAQIEKMFFKKPFKIFTELEDAVTWAKETTQMD